MAVKMKDIALELGVSLVTVSKAVHNHPDISEATRLRVMERVKALGYRPNLAARALVTGRSSLIGLIVPSLVYPFFADVAKSLSLVLRERGYFLLISASEEDPQLEQQEIEAMLAHRLDAMVVASCAENDTALRRVEWGDAPLILIDRSFDDFPAHFVGSDDYALGKLAAEHLMSVGCKRFAHIRGPETNVGERRLQGFAETLEKAGIALAPECVVKARSVDVDGKKRGADALHVLLSLPEPPDGVFCYNDVLATGVIIQAKEEGVAIPQQMAVIGCGDLHFDDALRVPLSSVDQRTGEIGRRTAKLILDLIDSKQASTEFQKVIVQPQLVVRESTEGVRVKKSPKITRKGQKEMAGIESSY